MAHEGSPDASHTASTNGSEYTYRGSSRVWTGLVAGFVLGVVVAGLGVWLMMPGMMIVTESSPLDFDATVARLEESIAAEGWASPGTLDLNKSLEKHGHPFGPRVKVVQLCKAPYAHQVLTDERHVSCLMPCSIAVWEADDGTVKISKMNTGLMGKLFRRDRRGSDGGQSRRGGEAHPFADHPVSRSIPPTAERRRR